MDIAISVKRDSSASRNNFSEPNISDTELDKFHLLLLGINSYFNFLVDISAILIY